ncbi:MAG: regulatory protein RecX [Lysobacteraceae bacterium]
MAGKRDRDTPPDAYNKALSLLVRREHSRRELSRKLRARGIEAEAADAAMDKLAGQGFQDEARFAQSLVRSRANGGHGPVRIRAELATHGLPSELIASAMEACETDWAQSAQAVLERRHTSAELADPNKRRKAVEFLLRRGFALDMAYAVVAQMRAGDDEA